MRKNQKQELKRTLEEKCEKSSKIGVFRKRAYSQYGAISLFVLVACMFFLFIVGGQYIRVHNKKQAQDKDIRKIQQNYEMEPTEVDRKYDELKDGINISISSQPLQPSYENNGKVWSKGASLSGTATVEENYNINISKYAFIKKDDYGNVNWVTASNNQNISVTDNVNQSGNYYFAVRDNNGKLYRSGIINLDGIDGEVDQVGTLNAVNDEDNTDVYDLSTSPSTENSIRLTVSNGTDNKSGHKSTTFTVYKDNQIYTQNNVTYSGLTQAILDKSGEYTVVVTTTDNLDNSASRSYTVRIDKVVPEMSLKYNNAQGAPYESGVWTNSNLYGEINIDTSSSGKTVDHYQYSYDRINWMDISAEPVISSLDYTSTFPLDAGKPAWFSGPINADNTYFFTVDQITGALKPNNSGVNSKTAKSYFEIDLSAFPDATLNLSLNTTISSESGCDIGYATITETLSSPAYNTTAGRFIYVSGSTTTKDYSTTLTGGKKYYLYVGYRKDGSVHRNNDTFLINSITLEGEGLGKGLNFNNYSKNGNIITFNLNEDLDEENIYIKAVYTDETESKTSEPVSIKMDKKVPIINSANSTVTSLTTADLSVEFSDKGSGAKGYYISTEDVAPTGSSTWVDFTTQEKLNKSFTLNDLSTGTTYYLWIKDASGNISEKKEINIEEPSYCVDDTIYTGTLQQALERAQDGSTIELLKDCTDTSTATISNTNITFDVKNHTLTRTGEILINTNKVVEITGTGKITTGTSSVRTITNNGTLTLSDSITIENMSTSSSYAPIYTNNSNSITNINDNVNIIGYYRGIYNNSGTVNINGGYIEATYNNSSAYGLYKNNANCTVYINGGEIKGYNGIYNYGLLEISEGKIIGTGAYGINVVNNANTITNINGGRIEGKTYGVYSNGTDKVTIGRQEDALSDTSPAIYGATYGVYMSNVSYGFNFYNGIIISNTEDTKYRGVANLRTDHMEYTFYDYNKERKYVTKLVPSVANITMSQTPTEYTNEYVTVQIVYPNKETETRQYSEDGNEWKDFSGYFQELLVDENKTIYARTINQSGVITDENQIVVNNIDKENPEVTVTPIQTNYVVINQNDTVNISATLTATDTGVSGLGTLKYAWAREGEEVVYQDFVNGATISKTGLTVGQYILYLNVVDNAGNRADLEQIRYNVKYQEPVAQIGSTTYTTIQSAVDACSQSAGDTQTTILILKSTDEEFQTYEGQNIILDLQGFTIGSSNIATPICTNNGTLQIIDSNAQKSGKLESMNFKAIVNNGAITLGDSSNAIEDDTPTIYGRKIGVENNSTFNYYDGTIQGRTAIKGDVQDTPEEYGPVGTYENGITTVNLRIISGYEARIEWTYYTKVQLAIDQCHYKTSAYDTTMTTVTILKNITMENSAVVSNGQSVRLNLNGYILTSLAGSVIINNGNLDITDLTSEKEGKIQSSIEGTSASVNSVYKVIDNNDNLTISGGTIFSDRRYNYPVNNIDGIVRVVDEGIIDSVSTVNSYGIFNTGTGIVEVKGGNINVSNNGNDSYGIYNSNGKGVKISGGNINVNNSNGTAYGIYDASNTPNGVMIEMSDGCLNVNVSNPSSGNAFGISFSNGNSAYTNGKIMKIDGGNINCSGKSCRGITSYRLEIFEINGGIINCRGIGKSSNAIAVDYGYGTININGGEIYSTFDASDNGYGNQIYGIDVSSSGKVVIEEGIIKCFNSQKSGNYVYGIRCRNEAEVEMKGGIVDVLDTTYVSRGISNQNRFSKNKWWSNKK